MVELKEINKENVLSIVDLDVHENQRDQVAPNAVSISQGSYEEKAWFRGIFANDKPVGFVMLHLDHDKSEYGVWRFMIDKNHQGKGYGRESMTLIKKAVKELAPSATEIELSYVPKEEGGADEFYRKVGFEDTGKMADKEKIMLFKY